MMTFHFASRWKIQPNHMWPYGVTKMTYSWEDDMGTALSQSVTMKGETSYKQSAMPHLQQKSGESAEMSGMHTQCHTHHTFHQPLIMLLSELSTHRTRLFVCLPSHQRTSSSLKLQFAKQAGTEQMSNKSPWNVSRNRDDEKQQRLLLWCFPLVRTCNKPHIPITCIICRELAILAVSRIEVAASSLLPV